MLEPPPTETFYFGDLDLAGLRIAASAAAQASATGLPELQPAASCYLFLLDGPQRWKRADSSNRHSKPDYEAVCRWLPGSLQAQARALLQATDSQRVPQERLGLQDLRQSPHLLTALADGHETQSTVAG